MVKIDNGLVWLFLNFLTQACGEINATSSLGSSLSQNLFFHNFDTYFGDDKITQINATLNPPRDLESKEITHSQLDLFSRWGLDFFTKGTCPNSTGLPPPPQFVQKLNLESSTLDSLKIRFFKFDNANGKITHYSILVGEKVPPNHIDYSYCETNCTIEKSWQQAHKDTTIEMYQATPFNYYPNNGYEDYFTYLIGEEKSCLNYKNDSEYCNGPLKAGTKYQIILRAYTCRGYRDSRVFSFTTDGNGNAYLITTIVAVVIFLGSFVAFSYIYVIRRRKQWQMKRKKQNKLKIDLGITAGIEDSQLPENNQLVDIDYINEEYKKLEKHSQKIHHHCTNGADVQNKEKNRYGIIPYDYNRVKLPGAVPEDYINASFINGIDGVNKFIATQGPKHNTAADFWKMVATQNVSVIIMLCKAVEQKKVKCDLYYPEAGQSKHFGDFSVFCIQRQPNNFFIIRDLILVQDGQKQNISHFQYLDWPDFGVPTSVKTLINFCSLVGKAEGPANKSGPLLVHCSAGCGRTGTFIALYDMLKMRPSEVDIYAMVYKLRDQRMGMVQTRDQYIFLHKCLSYLKKTRTN